MAVSNSRRHRPQKKSTDIHHYIHLDEELMCLLRKIFTPKEDEGGTAEEMNEAKGKLKESADRVKKAFET